MAAISGTDLALTTARVGAARVGSFRVGFIPCATTGPGSPWFGEYIWDELKPPTTQWTLQSQDCVCGQQPDAAFTMTGVSQPPVVVDTSTVNGTVTYDAPGGPFAWPAINVVMLVDGVPWPGGDAITDALGYYEFLLVPAGAIDVSVSGIAPAVGQRDDTNSGVTVPPATLTLDLYAIGS